MIVVRARQDVIEMTDVRYNALEAISLFRQRLAHHTMLNCNANVTLCQKMSGLSEAPFYRWLGRYRRRWVMENYGTYSFNKHIKPFDAKEEVCKMKHDIVHNSLILNNGLAKAACIDLGIDNATIRAWLRMTITEWREKNGY